MPLKMRLSETVPMQKGIVSIWIQAFRLHYVPTSILPAILGSVIAWAAQGLFNLWYFVLVIAGVTLHHIGLNMIDDVFDYLHAVDKSQGAQKNPYTGGSGVIADGLLSVNHVLAAAVSCYLLAVIIGVYLTFIIGWPILIFALIGAFSSIYYTMPPIKYGYRGFGEFGLLINFGPVACLGAFYVQTQSISWEPLIVSLVPGFLMWSMIIINEIPDYEEDRLAGKWNLVASFGRKSGVILYVAGLVCAYGTMLLAVYFRVSSINVLLGFLTVPVAYNAFRILKKNYMDKMKMAPANLATIKVHMLTLLCLIAGYIAKGAMA